MSADMPKSRNHILATVSVSSGRFKRFVRSVRARFRRLDVRVRKIETTVDPLVDHVANLEDLVRDLHQRQRRRRERRAA